MTDDTYRAIVLPGDAPDVEPDLRTALYRLIREDKGGDWAITSRSGSLTQYGDFVSRPVIITLFEGAYGVAGAVLCVNGSPPKGLVVVHTTGSALFREGNNPYLDIIRLWRSKGSERIAGDWPYRTASYKLAAAQVIVDYLTRQYEAGAFYSGQ